MIERITILGTGLLGTSAGLALRAAGFAARLRDGTGALKERRPRSRWAPWTCWPQILCRRRGRARWCCWRCPYTPRSIGWSSYPGCWARSIWLPMSAAPRRRSRPPRPPLQHAGACGFSAWHPMAGKERGGGALGDANLFRGAVWLFTDDPGCSARRLRRLWSRTGGSWVGALGSRTIDMTPRGTIVGGLGESPAQFVATALSALLEEEVGDAPELKDVGGRALRR